jgi:hypothetical protein
MPIILHYGTERPARADIDPLLTAPYEELQPRLAEIDYLSFGFGRFIDADPESGTARADPQAAVNLKFMQLDL